MTESYDKAAESIKKHSRILKFIFIGVLCAGYAAYFIAACVLNFQRAIALLVITCVVLFFFIYDLLVERFGNNVKQFFKPLGKFLNKYKQWIKWVFAALVLIGLIIWLALDTAKIPAQLISFGGVCMFVILLFLTSKHHRRVSMNLSPIISILELFML
ncbi:hypothetical protein GDO81_020381 [Engystomops pustulosus]|uniref:Uncharacterized protein n=1 Tax=Engystomops pustulosus TaxID=76066 RepID=A0AAV6YS71_ENGPU|nr:hypothetical protein GDO81_020381 [Engystomops pustulosus]